MHSQYSSLGPVFKWKEEQAGTAKAVQSMTLILSNGTRMVSKAKKIVQSYAVSSMYVPSVTNPWIQIFLFLLD